MAREMVYTCDNCGGEDAVETSIDTYVVDLCPTCRNPILEVALKGREATAPIANPRGTSHYDSRVRNLPLRGTA